MATRFTLESASARVTCASTPGLFTRKTLNWVCTWVISMAGGGFERLFLRRLDGEHLIQTCDAKQFHQPGPHAAENEVALLERLELFLHGQQDSDGLRGKVLHLLKIENDAAFVLFVDELIELLGDLLQLDGIHQGGRGELDNGV